MNANVGKILVDGNDACAIGALFAGVTVVTWYPITPSSSLVEKLAGHLRRHRTRPDGKATYAVVQAEDELSAIGMVLGAGWAGARAMTATSGPGISLMSEFAGLGYYAEIPAVVFDVQRVGPSTGLPTRTAQGDVLSTALLSHGDTRHILLFPGSVEECFSLGAQAFDLAERFQTPVFVLTDLDLGMNTWVGKAFEYPPLPHGSGKVLTDSDLERLGGFARYKDVDGDGIGWRTLPGTRHSKAAYFTRGTGHDENATYSENGDVFERNMARLEKKLEGARSKLPAPMRSGSGSEVGIVSYGSSQFAVEETQEVLRRRYGLETDHLRVRSYPFHEEVERFLNDHERVYVVEQNRDGQLFSLMRMDLKAEHLVRLSKDCSRERASSGRCLGDEGACPEGGSIDGHPAEARRRAAEDESAGAHGTRLSRREDHPVRRLRSQRHQRANRGGHVQSWCLARAGRQGFGDWLFLEEPRLLYEPVSRAQRRPWANALFGHRDSTREPRAPRGRRVGRRGYGLDWRRAVHPPHAPQRADGLHRGEQRGVWPHERAVQRHGRPRLDAEGWRGERTSSYGHVLHRYPTRSQFRRSVVLGR